MTRSTRFFTLAAALLPMFAEWIYKYAIRPRPFWVHYYDPEAIYFYQSLRILAGEAPLNVHNPGTPVQLAGAAVALFTGRSPLMYERFISVAHVVGLLVTIIGAWLLMRTLLRDAAPALAIAALWTWFMAPQALEYQMVWSAEMFFFGLGAAALAAIVASFSFPRTVARDALAGLAVGVLIATKFIFLSWLAALVVAYLVSRERAAIRIATATLGAAAGFVAATLVAITRYPAMFSWLTQLASRSGEYGGGKRELPRLGDAMTNYAQLATTSKAWMLWLAIVAACAVVVWKTPRLRPIIAFAAVASALTVIMAIRTPQFRYLFPIALCAVLVLGIAASELRNVRWLPVALLAVSAFLLGKAIVGDARNHRQRLESQVALHDSVAETVRRVAPNGVVVYSWRIPTPSFALRIEATNAAELAEIARRYPRDGHYLQWGRRVFLPPGAKRWDVLVIDESLLPQFPMPVGRTVARFNEFRIVLPPESP